MPSKKRAKLPWRKPKNFEPMACFVTPQQKAALKALSARTLIPQQALLRKAIDELLKNYTEK